MLHHSNSLFNDPIISRLFGNLTYTVTTQTEEPAAQYSFFNIGFDGSSTGYGANYKNWLGASIYETDDVGFGFSLQISPWFTRGIEWSWGKGLSFSTGIIIGDTTHEWTITIGNGTLFAFAICFAIASIPGFKLVAALAAACLILCAS